jgi:hypothetical protein
VGMNHADRKAILPGLRRWWAGENIAPGHRNRGVEKKAMGIQEVSESVQFHLGLARDVARVRSLGLVFSLLGPASRGFLLKRGKKESSVAFPSHHQSRMNWDYSDQDPTLRKLYEHAKVSQWDASRDVDWSIDVDPENPDAELVADELLPLRSIPAYRALGAQEQRRHRHGFTAWMLSQFLHGEQGALLAACQVTEAVENMDAKLYGSSQVVDEGRHVDVFHRYLHDKLGKVYQINDNLYVILDALMTDARWDIKFLGMQIMIEGLALGSFGVLRSQSQEPLLRHILKLVISDEARHVHFGVCMLEPYYRDKITANERREREDWAFEMSLLMRNRFLAHEFYDEYYGHALRRSEWDELVLDSGFMQLFRDKLFRRVMPNLRRIHLISDRVRPYYEQIGILKWESSPSAPELSEEELLAG